MMRRPSRPLAGPFKGKTHPPRYRFHKYWARKPFNIIRNHIEYYTRRNDIVLDSFCGSGVCVVEALISSRRAIGVDINPTAMNIVRATLDQWPQAELIKELERLRATVGEHIHRDMSVGCPSCGSPSSIRYRVWSSVATCPGCSRLVVLGTPEETKKRRGQARCPDCSTYLPAKTVRTERLQSYAVDCRTCRPGSTLFPASGEAKLPRPSGPHLLENSRILAHRGLRLSSLYCRENWRHLTLLKKRIDETDSELRPALVAAFTSTAAQASRLIPFRKNLSTGGPAWTVPGFWVPRVHLQMNVWRAFESRLRRVASGLRDAAEQLPEELAKAETPERVVSGTGQYWVGLGDARRLDLPDETIDYIITDPPYGDSVPYLEFSQLWNHWLDDTPDFDSEITVSNSPVRDKGLAAYEEDLAAAFSEMARVLKRGRWLTVFFQNRNLSVWRALGDAAAKGGFVLEDVALQQPAVVPAKSQLSRSGSLTGDIILQFRKPARAAKRRLAAPSPKGWRKKALAAARNMLEERGGEAPFEELASTVLVALWKSRLQVGEGDLATLFASEFETLPRNRFKLP